MARPARLELATATSIDPTSIVPTQIALRNLGPATTTPSGDGTPVDVRLVLSASGRMLALVPTERLAADTRFRITATGLHDLYGGAIVVPVTTFVTTADVAPVYAVEQLVVSFPDEDGTFTLRGPAGTLPPGRRCSSSTTAAARSPRSPSSTTAVPRARSSRR